MSVVVSSDAVAVFRTAHWRSSDWVIGLDDIVGRV